ncbi:hypothetical protein GGS21DRAFT_293920 [Xylaria nigripes]|nr:hypothetical protein GGS21DRAFT_293920 [Xylaria nigripes]
MASTSTEPDEGVLNTFSSIQPSPDLPNQSVPLLQLPVELVQQVAQFLKPVDITLLSQTCRSLWAAFGESFRPGKISDTDRLPYLVGLARSKPDVWVCGDCTILHPVDNPHDTPIRESKGAVRLTCPKLRIKSFVFGGVGEFQARLEHRHVQLALKYTRLQQPEYDEYLRALLKPHEYVIMRSDHPDFVGREIYDVKPRVCTDDDGNLRFLLLSTWLYITRGGGLLGNNGYTIKHKWAQLICPHLGITRNSVNNNALTAAIRQVFIDGASSNRPARIGSCYCCATDFSVQWIGANLVLRAWQDFGSEVSPTDLAWQTHIIKDKLVLRCEYSGFTASTGTPLYHEPGSVRRLYEKDGVEALIPSEPDLKRF